MKRSTLRLLLCAWMSAVMPAHAFPRVAVQDVPRSPESKKTRPAASPPKAVEAPTPERQQTQRPELSALSLNVLHSTAKEARDWKNTTAAVSILTQISDLTWHENESAAQSYLVQAWELTDRVEGAKEASNNFRNHTPRTGARREVIMVARRRAPELAEKWLAQMAEEDEAQREKSKSPRGAFDDRTGRSAVLLQLAMSSIEENPQAASRLATESLQDGISFGLQHVLIKLQEKDFDLAQAVFRAALERLKIVGMLDPNELLILYSYLYTPGTILAANTTNNAAQTQLSQGRAQPPVRTAADLNPALAHEFLKTAADLLTYAPLPSATANPQATARAQISVINVLLEKLLRELPEQAAALRMRAQQNEADAQFDPTSRTAQTSDAQPRPDESREDYAQRRIEYLEETAGKETDPLRRNILYAKAALATTVEQYEKGVAVAQRIRDEELRVSVVDWLSSRAALRSAEAGNLDKTYELLKKTTDPRQKAVCLVVGAQKLAQAKDTARAAQWLQEARAIIKSAEPDEALTRIAWGVVSTYVRFDNMSALQALDDAVKLINQSPITPLGSDKAPQTKRLAGLANTDITFGTAGFGLGAAIGEFDSASFENVLETLKKIATAELRGIALVTLCRKHIKAPTPARADPLQPRAASPRFTPSPVWRKAVGHESTV